MDDDTFKPFQGHTLPIASLAYSPDGKCIATGSWDGTIRIWEVMTGRQVGKTLNRHGRWVRAIAYSTDGRHLVSGSDDGYILIWDTVTHETIMKPLEGHADSVLTVQYSPDGALIASGGADYLLKLWGATSGVCVAAIKHPSCISSLAFSPNSKHIVIACSDYLIRIYDVDRRELVYEPISGHRTWIQSVQYSPDGRRIASASHDHTIHLWDARTGKLERGPLRGHRSYVNGVSFSGDGLHLVSCSQDTSVRIWDIAGEDITSRPLYGHTDASGAVAVACSPDGEHFASCDRYSVRIWSMRTGESVLPKLSANESQLYKPQKMSVPSKINTVAWFPDGKHFALARDDNAVSICNAQTGKESQDPLVGHGHMVKDIDISRSGNLLAIASLFTTVCVRDVERGEFAVTPPLRHAFSVYAVRFTPDEARLAIGCTAGDIYIWAVHSKVSLHVINAHSNYVISLSISADGSQLASGSGDDTIRLWDLQSYAAVSEPLACEGNVPSVCFSPDSSQVLSGSNGVTGNNHAVCLWDVSRRKPISTFKYDKPVRCVRFSSNGTRFLSASWDGKVNVWEASTRKLLHSLQHDGRNVNAAAFSPDGARIVSGTDDGKIGLWDVETGKLLLPKDDTASKDVTSSRPLQITESTDSLMNMPAFPGRRSQVLEAQDTGTRNHPGRAKSSRRARQPNSSASISGQEGAGRSTARRHPWFTLPVLVSPGRMKPRSLVVEPQSAGSQRQPRRQSTSASSSDSSDDENNRQEQETVEVEGAEATAGVEEADAQVGCVASIFCCFGSRKSLRHNGQAEENIEMSS